MQDAYIEETETPAAVASNRVETYTRFFQGHHTAAAMLVKVALDMVFIVNDIVQNEGKIVSDMSFYCLRTVDHRTGTSSSILFFSHCA